MLGAWAVWRKRVRQAAPILFLGAMILRHRPYTLRLRHAFGIASNTRTSTPAMLVELEHEGVTGFGEASMPPYLGETQAGAASFLDRAARLLADVRDPF